MPKSEVLGPEDGFLVGREFSQGSRIHGEGVGEQSGCFHVNLGDLVRRDPGATGVHVAPGTCSDTSQMQGAPPIAWTDSEQARSIR